MSFAAPVPVQARCRAVPRFFRLCCAPTDVQDWQARLGCDDNPRSDSPGPSVQPMLRAPPQSSDAQTSDWHFRRTSEQSVRRHKFGTLHSARISLASQSSRWQLAHPAEPTTIPASIVEIRKSSFLARLPVSFYFRPSLQLSCPLFGAMLV